jgi:hypothetical protein
VELTGTNRSNPLDPDLLKQRPDLSRSLEKDRLWRKTGPPPACSGKPPARHPLPLMTAPPDDGTARHKAPDDTSRRLARLRKFPNPAPRGRPLWRPAAHRGDPSQPPKPARGGRDSLVATARGPAPDPIPNSAVKTLSADGTASQDAEEQVAARLSRPPSGPLPRAAPAHFAAARQRSGSAKRAQPAGPPARPTKSPPRGGAAR